jgi:hypothetical protein
MGLLQTKLQSNINEYVRALSAIEYLALMTTDKTEIVAKYLLNNQVEFLLDSYVVNDLFQINETGCDCNGIYAATLSILNTVANFNQFTLDWNDRLSLTSFDYPELKQFENLYWKKSDLFNLPAIIEAGLKLEEFEKVKSEYKINLNLTKFVNTITKDRGVDAPIHIVKLFNKDYYTIEEAALFIHSNRDEDDKYHFDIEPDPSSMSFIGDFIKRGQLTIEKDGSISKDNLKAFLSSTDYIINGFNDYSDALESLKLTIKMDKLIKENEKIKGELRTLKEENLNSNNSENDQSSFGTTTIGHVSLEHYKKHRDELLVEVEKLRAENDELKREGEKLFGINDEINPLNGLARRNHLAKDRNGMARVIASYLWQQDKHKNKLPKDIALLVQKEMMNYCNDNEIPKTIVAMKKIISPIVPNHVRDLIGRPPNKSNS